MVEFFMSVHVQVLFLMFFWVPFALGAYLAEDVDARQALRKLTHPLRHIEPERPVATGTA
jgi:hypothetical protein